MVKLVYCVRRRADVPAEEFYRYWLEVHGPKVRSVAESRVFMTTEHTIFAHPE